ncbi:MAG: hypothetical protein OXI38_11415 [Bacteroidota bacterium]|nr:hypothetical protein [Bacteroidota bacterium]
MRLQVTGLFLVLLVTGCDTTPSASEEPAAVSGRGAVIAAELIGQYPAAAINGQIEAFGLPFAARYGADVFHLTYETVDAQGGVTQASGAVVVPMPVLGVLNILSFQHGTTVIREDVPSREAGEFVPGLAFASDGYLVALPDYLGLGDSPGLHPYLLAEPTGIAVVDMLRAVRHLAQSRQWSLSGELFLAGYSEGGYATMAAHRALEAEYASEFTVTASAPMAGPYDLSGTMYELILIQRAPYANPYYLPYVLFAYNEVYGLFEHPSEYLRSPWDATLPPLFDGLHSGRAINAEMPQVPIDIIREDVAAALMNDPAHPMRQALRENDLTDWAPKAPVRLYHCAGDELVPKLNSEVALAEMDGAVELVDPSAKSDHGDCAVPSILGARAWFNSF